MAGGESRHWIQYETSPIKENEGILSRAKRSAQYSTNYYRGGFDQINGDVSLHRERTLLQLGGEGSDEIISGKSTYDTEVQRRNELHVQHVRGWL